MIQIKKIISNKVLLYVSTRYLVYGLQFVSLIIVSSKLGSYRYGIWGFILMLLSYLNIINLGIPNSINVLMVQHKKNIDIKRNFIASAFLAISILICVILILGISLFILNPDKIFTKFPLGSWIYIVLIIGGLQYVNVLMVNIFRADNRLLEVAIYQSSIPLGVFAVSLIIRPGLLINALILIYLIMNFSSLIFFLIRGKYFFGGHASWVNVKTILNKGLYLFLYNACFYLIITTTSSLVSGYYTVSQYGDYAFSYTLGHSILLLMEAFMYVMFPKIIDKFYIGDNEEVWRTIGAIRVNYISMAHGLIYLAIAFFPLLIQMFHGFKSSLITLNFMMLAIVLSTNAFGFNTFLIARNKEKLCSLISIVTLIVNILCGWIFSNVIHVQYYLMPLTIMCSYILFATLCSYFSHKLLCHKIRAIQLISSIMPIRIAIPYLTAIGLAYLNNYWLSWIPLTIFCLMNTSTLKEIFITIKRIVNRPQIVDISKE